MKSSLWADFMHSKYDVGQDFTPLITDTTTWKHICAIDPLCSENVTGTIGDYTWTLEPNGIFTLLSAYTLYRQMGETASP